MEPSHEGGNLRHHPDVTAVSSARRFQRFIAFHAQLCRLLPRCNKMSNTRQSVRAIPLLELMRQSLLAMLKPHKAFTAIRGDEHLPYALILPFMVLWGWVYAHLHFLAIDHMRLSQYPINGSHARLLTFLLVSPSIWLLGTWGIMTIRWVCRKPVSVAWAEIAAWYLWLVWAVMPLFDLVHLFGISTRTVVVPYSGHALVGHASWLVAFPLLFVQLISLISSSLPRCWWRWPAAFLNAVVCLGVARLVIEPLPEMVIRRLGQAGYSIDLWMASDWLLVLGFVWLIGWRAVLTRRLPQWAIVTGAGMASTQIIWWGFRTHFILWGY